MYVHLFFILFPFAKTKCIVAFNWPHVLADSYARYQEKKAFSVSRISRTYTCIHLEKVWPRPPPNVA